MKLGVKNTRATKNGSFIIKCDSKKDMEILKHEVESTLRNYEVQITKMNQPRFKIVGYEGALNREEIEGCIREQNKFISENDVNHSHGTVNTQ